MPLIDTNDPAVWASLYTVYVDGEVCHFERRARDRIIGVDADHLASALEGVGLLKTDRIAFIGAGFGWMGERFAALGYQQVVNVDTSSWIQSNKGQHAVMPILDVEILTELGRDALGPCDWVISEDVLPCLTDAECRVFMAAMREVAPQRAHWITPGTAGGETTITLNWKPLEDWKAMCAPDYVVRRGGKEVA